MSRRALKAAQAVREVVSMAILTDLRDPRIQNVTVTRVEVSPDLQRAKVHISVMGDEAAASLSLHGLQNASGYLQSKVAKRIDARYTPRLTFAIDDGVKKSLAVAQILQEVLPKDPPKSDSEDIADDEHAEDQLADDLNADDLNAEDEDGIRPADSADTDAEKE